jgi:hypothetical protein
MDPSMKLHESCRWHVRNIGTIRQFPADGNRLVRRIRVIR